TTVRGHCARRVPDSDKMTDAGSKDPPAGSTRVSRTTWSSNPNSRYRQKVARCASFGFVDRGIVYDRVRVVVSGADKGPPDTNKPGAGSVRMSPRRHGVGKVSRTMEAKPNHESLPARQDRGEPRRMTSLAGRLRSASLGRLHIQIGPAEMVDAGAA